MFSMPIIQLLFGEVYTPGSGVLCILVIGMSFYSIYMISSSILQGTGNPKLPMYILLLGTVLNIVLNAIFVQMMGIVGAAIATTITTGILMIIIMLFVIRTTKISIPWKNILLVLICNLILMVVCYVIPKTLIGLIIGIIIGSLIYIVALIRLKVLTKRDMDFFSQYMNKIPILKKYTPKIVKYIEKRELLYKIDD
jgi:stage V sporulation protein B